MSIRSDIIINWNADPRIITIQAPSVSANIQDIIDTLRNFEVSIEGMDEPYILEASGKEKLEGGKFVGLTVQLQNALIEFEGRLSPPWASCAIVDGNLTAVDKTGQTIYPINGTPYINISFIQSTSASIIATGSAVTEQDKVDIVEKVWRYERV